MFCGSCGFQNAQGTTFCGKCGAAMPGVAAPQPTPVSRPAAQIQPQPMYQQPTPQPRPSYNYSSSRSYSSTAIGLSWGIFAASAVGIGGCFLPMVSGVSESSMFNHMKATFTSGMAGLSQKVTVMYPAAYVLILLFSLLLGINALGKRAGWNGLIAVFSGWIFVYNLSNLIVTEGQGLSFGFWLMAISAVLIMLMVIVQLFVEAD